jgi:hypothetical protein
VESRLEKTFAAVEEGKGKRRKSETMAERREKNGKTKSFPFTLRSYEDFLSLRKYLTQTVEKPLIVQ